MASSGSVLSGTPASNVGLYPAQFKFNWSSSPSSEPGITNVTWYLYATGKSGASSNTKAYGECYIWVYDEAGGTIVGGSGQQICGYVSGSTTATYASFTDQCYASGTFQVQHSSDGTGGFRIFMDVNIGGWKTESGRDMDGYGNISLDANIPYRCIYIDNGSSFDAYEIYIDNGSSWDKYIAYIDNGSGWDMCY